MTTASPASGSAPGSSCSRRHTSHSYPSQSTRSALPRRSPSKPPPCPTSNASSDTSDPAVPLGRERRHGQNLCRPFSLKHNRCRVNGIPCRAQPQDAACRLSRPSRAPASGSRTSRRAGRRAGPAPARRPARGRAAPPCAGVEPRFRTGFRVAAPMPPGQGVGAALLRGHGGKIRRLEARPGDLAFRQSREPFAARSLAPFKLARGFRRLPRRGPRTRRPCPRRRNRRSPGASGSRGRCGSDDRTCAGGRVNGRPALKIAGPALACAPRDATRPSMKASAVREESSRRR